MTSVVLLLSFNVTDLISIQEKTITTVKTKLAEENSNKATESSQLKERGESELGVGRKRCFEDKPTVEEPPPKKGTVSSIAEQGVFQKTKLIPIPEWKQKVVKHISYGTRRKSRVIL